MEGGPRGKEFSSFRDGCRSPYISSLTGLFNTIHQGRHTCNSRQLSDHSRTTDTAEPPPKKTDVNGFFVYDVRSMKPLIKN